jgi:Flp pilus assembly protein TadG
MYTKRMGHNPPPSARQRWGSSRGQVMVIFASGLVLLMAMVAMAIDAGFLMAERRQVQNAADAAALAAAKAKLDNWELSSMEQAQRQAAIRYATGNADTDASNVAVDTSPDGYGDEYVEVTVSRAAETFFLRAVYTGDWSVTASAVAGIVPIQQPYALLALDCGSGGKMGIEIDGGGSIDVNEGSIMSNCGIAASGTSNIVTAGGSIDASGTIESNSNWYAGQGIRPFRPSIPDPIAQAGIVPPTKSFAQAINMVTTQDELHQNVSNSNKQGSSVVRCPNGVICEMEPGYYGGNLTLDVHGTLVMKPGLYYFGDSFKLEGQSASTQFQGSDVFLYFGDSASFDPKHAKIVLSAAPESLYPGGLDGMLLWIDNGTPFLMQSNGQFQLEGVLYAPQSRVRLFGAPGTQGVQVIVKSLELAGGNTYDILYTEYIDMNMPQVFLVQ